MISCHRCSISLDEWSIVEFRWLIYCPNCGAKLLKKEKEELHCLTTDEDIDNHIRGNLLDMLDDLGGGGLGADELADRAWESENANGVVFCSHYEADKFVTRHRRWVDQALEYVCNEFGEADYYVKMKTDCDDKFLVVAFIEATRRYLYDQLAIDCNEGSLSKKRICEIKRQIKETPYEAVW